MKPPIWWYGGKALFVDTMLPYIPTHDCYVEPYGGAAALLFAKEPSRVEIYNDLHEGVVNLYYVLRHRPEEFITLINLTPYSREELERAWWHTNVITDREDSLGRIENARAFFVVARQSFSARTDAKPGWGSSKKTNKAMAWFNAIDGLAEAHERLKNVQIECKPAVEVIKKYDGRDTFMYLDPPYISESRKETKAYKHEMDDNDHLMLIATIKRCSSMFLVSGYHNELYDECLGGWHYKDTGVMLQAGNTKNVDMDRKRVEVLWWNDALEANRIGAQQLLDLEV